ncbi:hypothetical protein PI124_g2478 [Phytophthora idaei]|nr:hypothetical protein PI124_g2478 [Phytophthora idaei]
MDDVPGEVDAPTISGSEGPLNEDDLPETSFLERRTIGDEETAISGVNYPIMDIVAKRVEARQFENAENKRRCLPEIRRSARLVEANATVDEDELLF